MLFFISTQGEDMKKSYKHLYLSVLYFSILSGCATAYHPYGIGGGYSNIRLDKDIYIVLFRGNGYTSVETVQRYLLYRAAELTKQNNYKYFVILDGKENVDNSSYTSPTTISGNTYGTYNAYGNYGWNGYGSSSSNVIVNPGHTNYIKKYTESITIKLFDKKPSKALALSADYILQSMP